MRCLSIAILVGVLSFASGASAETGSPVAAYLVQAGKAYYQAGDYVSALHEFSKAVMVDPNNEEAQKYLKFLGADGGVYARPDSEVSAVVRLGQEIDRYRGEVVHLQKDKTKLDKVNRALRKENQQLNHTIYAQEVENTRLWQKVQDSQVEAAAQADRDRLRIDALKDLAKEKSLEISRLNMDVVQLKGDLDQQTALVVQKDGEIQDLSDQYRQTVETAEKDALERENLLRSAEKQVKEKTQEIASLNANLYHFKKKYSARMNQLNDLKDQMQDSSRQSKASAQELRESKLEYESKLYALQKDYAQLKAEAAQKDASGNDQVKQMQTVLRRQSTDIGQLKDRLVATQYQLALRQQQILAKDQAITDMKQTITRLESKVIDWQAKVRQQKESQTTATPSSDPAVAKAQQEQVQFIKRQDKQIADLKDRLMAARLELGQLKSSENSGSESGGEENEARIAALRQQLRDIQQQLNEKDEALRNKETEFAAMDERMKDNQDRLELVERILQEKDQQIKDLEKQLSEVITRFDQ